MQSDLFATKGIEYLLVISYLLLLVACRRFIFPRKQSARPEPATYRLDDSLFYHQGHTWAKPDGSHFVRIGMDDLAQAFLGEQCELTLPRVGTHVEEGEPAWEVQTHGQAVAMLSPVDGDVVAVNSAVLRDPHLLHEDPYERGWLMEIRVPHPETTHRNLLHGELAEAWMDGSREKLRDDSNWDALAREIFLLEEVGEEQEEA